MFKNSISFQINANTFRFVLLLLIESKDVLSDGKFRPNPVIDTFAIDPKPEKYH